MSLSMLATKKKYFNFLGEQKVEPIRICHSLGHLDVQQTLRTRLDKSGAELGFTSSGDWVSSKFRAWQKLRMARVVALADFLEDGEMKRQT